MRESSALYHDPVKEELFQIQQHQRHSEIGLDYPRVESLPRLKPLGVMIQRAFGFPQNENPPW